MDREKEIDHLMEMDGIKKRDWPLLVVAAALAFVFVSYSWSTR